MLLNAKLLVVLAFIILSLILIFTVKNRNNIITILIITHLVLILFLSLAITNYNSFKEIVLTLVIYLMTILFLIINNAKAAPIKEKKDFRQNPFAQISLAIFLGTIIFFTVFSLTKISVNSLQMLKNRAVENQIAGQIVEISEPLPIEPENRKKMRLKQELGDNFLMKRSSDIILIIAMIGCMILLFSQVKIKNKKK